MYRTTNYILQGIKKSFSVALLLIAFTFNVYSSTHEHLYTEMKNMNHNQLLFFTDERLNLAGITLISLLTDLGIREESSLTEVERLNITNTDKALTLTLYEIASQSNGNQLKHKANTPTDLIAAIKGNTLPQYIDASMPQFNAVIRLRSMIKEFKIKNTLPWPALTSTFNPSLGQGHKETINLRYKLVQLGDITTNKTSKFREHIFDKQMMSAVKKFQRRHGLKPTGMIDTYTRNALNLTLDVRIDKLQQNLWRWLSLPRIPPNKYILVNIPSYKLKLIEKGQIKLTTNVIVGTPTNQTPVMITSVNSVTLNPTWTPTRNIVYNELLPLHNRNNNTLKSRNFYLAQGYGNSTRYKEIPHNLKDMLSTHRLVQMPGVNNALGKARFNIINNNSIYLHDTPNKTLFKKSNRALSHGCVRVENIDALLNNLINERNTKKTKPVVPVKIAPKYIKLKNDIPVYITYQTAWVDHFGQLNWRDDLYGKDKPE